MSVRIRLRRIGRKKQPSYRLVIADSATPRDGAYLEAVGFYNPRLRPAELRLDLERVEEWLGRGANMSDTVASLVRIARRGGDTKVELKPVGGAPRPTPEAGAGVAAAPDPSASAGAVAAVPPAEAAPEIPARVEEEGQLAVTEAPEASAEPRRDAAGAPAEPDVPGSGAEPAKTEPPE